MLLLLCLGASLACSACRSPLGWRADALSDAPAESTPIGATDALPDQPPVGTADAAPDVPLADGPASDLAKDAQALRDLVWGDDAGPDQPATGGTPRAFRIDNRTDRTVYLPTNPYVLGGALDGLAPGPCSFYRLDCLPSCAAVQAGANCCVQCEQPLPAVFALAAGASLVVPWDGNLYAKATGTCSACECEATTSASSGSYQASTHAYTDYACLRYPCAGDGGNLIPMATPNGAETRILTTFQVPGPDSEILLVIDRLRGLDAGAPPDAAPVDLAVVRDTLPPGIPATFAAIRGHSFAIVASETPPDASARWDSPCRNAYPETIYDLTFSDDGTKVHLVSQNVPNHATMDGLLTSTSATRLVYSIDDGWAGAELVVRLDGGTLVGQLSIFGSGVPVVFCMESTMQPR